MARLITLNEIKKNGTVHAASIPVLMNTKKITEIRAVTENFSGTSTTYSWVKYRLNDSSDDDVFYSADPASAIQASINTPNTTNDIETIPLTILNKDLTVHNTEFFNPRFIQNVYQLPANTAHSVLLYEQPGHPYLNEYIVSESQSAILALANA